MAPNVSACNCASAIGFSPRSRTNNGRRPKRLSDASSVVAVTGAISVASDAYAERKAA